MSVETAPLGDGVERVREPVLTPGNRFEHVMALHFDPNGQYRRGVVRCVHDRSGQVDQPGFVDRSSLYAVETTSPFDATITTPVDIAGDTDILSGLPDSEERVFLGFEDPNLWREDGVLHLFCTIPFIDMSTDDLRLYLGHAAGEGLDSLAMTRPVLEPESGHAGAKEVAIAPLSTAGVRNNLVESSDHSGSTTYSVLRNAIATDLGRPWEYGGIALHPDDLTFEWCAGHLSTGPLLPRSFLDVGPDRRVGLLNGREANYHADGYEQFGTFTIGLMVYNVETGIVEWVSSEPLIDDPDAETITFASAFRQLDADTGVVYAHVDDARVRAYVVAADALDRWVRA